MQLFKVNRTAINMRRTQCGIHWSADVRYYDTDYSKDECAIQNGNRNGCDARAVGTLKVTF
jgi:hypothetical protein